MAGAHIRDCRRVCRMKLVDTRFSNPKQNASPVVSTGDLDANHANQLFASVAMGLNTAVLAIAQFQYNSTVLISCASVWDDQDATAPVITCSLDASWVKHRLVWPGYGHPLQRVHIGGVERSVSFKAAWVSSHVPFVVRVDVDSENSVVVTTQTYASIGHAWYYPILTVFVV